MSEKRIKKLGVTTCNGALSEYLQLKQASKSEIIIELINIEGSRREILEAFLKSPYLNVTYCIDLKIGT